MEERAEHEQEADPLVRQMERGAYREAVTLCATEHGAALGRLCMALLGCQAEAEEAVEEALVAAYDGMASYQGEGTVRAWLFGNARRQCARSLATRGRRDRRLRLGAETAAEVAPSDDLRTPQRRAERLRDALDTLRPSEREAVVLRYQAGLSYPEVADACGVAEADARQRVSRALGRLRASSRAEGTIPDELLDELGPLVDGEPDALSRFGDALTDSDALRDALFEAGELAGTLPDAGGDYEPPSNLTARVLTTLDARGTGGPTERSAEDEAPTRGTGRRSSPSARRWAVRAAVAATVVAAAGLLLLFRSPGSPPSAWPSDQAAGTTPAAGPTAIIEAVHRAGGSPTMGLAVVRPGASQPEAASEGEQLAPGSVIRTDPRTRARLRLDDGSFLTLQQDTELRLSDEGPREAHLARGEVWAEIAHLEEGPPARLHTASGTVEVLGTKFLLASSGEGTSVRVTQGRVALHAGGERVEVKAGQEGLAPSGRPPVLLPAVDLASSVAWTELDEAESEDLPIPGLGELRARRPGERQDQERPLRLAHHAVTVRIAGNVARTEIEETFQNDGPHTLEGIYRFPLPADARIASLALEVDGQWEQGSFVARDRAQRIWRGVIRNATPETRRVQEEFIWVPGPWRDPALLEWQQGGRFELRIFPIPARGARRIRIAYEQTVSPHGRGRRYVYPLPHASDDSLRVGRFEADVRVASLGGASVRASGYAFRASDEGDARRLAFQADDFHPAGSLVIDYEPTGDGAALRWWSFEGHATAAPPARSREGDDRSVAAHARLHEDRRGYVALALRPSLPAWSASRPRDYVVVVDASQSMVGERHDRAVRLVETMIHEMDRRDRVAVLACDATCRRPERFEPPHVASAAHAVAFLRKEPPAGASHVVGSLREAVAFGGERSARDRELHVIYIGDGMASVGPRRVASVVDEVRDLRTGPRVSITSVGIGQDTDTVLLSAIAREGGGHHVPYVPGQRVREAALAVLEATYGASVEGLQIELPPGIAAVAPTQLPNLRAGEELWLSGRIEGPVDGEVRITGTVAGEPWEARYPVRVLPSTAAGNAFVPRLWASASIAELELEGRGESVSEIVALSKAFGVMSRHTSLLVLESEAMFRAFGVDRAQPAVQWTGEDDMEGGTAEAMEEPSLGSALAGRGGSIGAGLGASSGVGLGAGSGAPARRSASAGPSGAPSFDAIAEAPAAAPPREERRPAPAEVIVMQPPVRSRPAPNMRRMRKVWFREGRVERGGVPDRDHARVAEAEAALRANPDSRDRHRDVVRALSRAGELPRAERAVADWLARDALDPEALIYKSDILGRLGRRDEALRTLAGVVDLDRDSKPLHARLASAFDRAGQPGRACDHRITVAEGDPSDASLVADAVRCERARGRSAGAERLLTMMPSEAARRRAAELAERAATPETVRGELVVDAHFSGRDDVDVSIVTPQGTRLSWMGGRRTVVADGATREGSEQLGLRVAGVGTYLLEVNRTRPGGGPPISGELRVRTRNESRTLPFVLEGDQVVVGRVSVVRRWRLEP